MANTLYKTTVRELEAVLPPRVVSQSLQEGLSAAGKNADTLAYGDAEDILKNRVLPRLTLSLGAERAEKARQGILERLAKLPDESQLPTLDLGAQGRALIELQAALKPFNIYFDWSETQKLRAQIAQLEAEHKAERNAGALIAAAQTQLGALQKKLDDELSVQARDLSVLGAALESSVALKSPKARRLGLLIELIRSTQAARKLAPAEVERAHKLAGDLSAERSRVWAEEVRALKENFSTLLTLEPSLAERLKAYEREGAETPQGSVESFRSELEAAQETLRSAFQREFQDKFQAGAGTLRPEDAQLLARSLSTLETTLPSEGDVQRLRDLIRSGAGDSTSNPDEDLTDFFRAAQRTLEDSRDLFDLTSGWGAEAQTENTGAASFAGRLAAAESAAATFSALTSEAATDLRGRMRRLRAQAASAEHATPEQQADLGTAFQETETLIASLQEEAQATQGVAAQLLQDDAFDDLFGFFGASETTKPAPPATPLPDAALQNWLEHQVAQEGVDGLALFADNDTLVAGELPTEAEALHHAVDQARASADTLAADLEQGDATTLSVETAEHTLVTFWLGRARSLVLVTRAQGDAARQRLEAALPELVTLLT